MNSHRLSWFPLLFSLLEGFRLKYSSAAGACINPASNDATISGDDATLRSSDWLVVGMSAKQGHDSEQTQDD